MFTGSAGQKQSGLREGGVKTRTRGGMPLKGGGVCALGEITKSQSHILFNE